MRKKRIILTLLVILVTLIGLFVILCTMEKPKKDDNRLYSKQFGNTILKFERYDYVLGQRMLVGVEKSTDKGKTYHKVTKEGIAVSNEAEFFFLNESLGFVNSTGSIMRGNDFQGFLITEDSGKTFQNAKFHYENDRVDFITIPNFPYYEDSDLKLKCLVYDINKEGNAYQEMEILFRSHDNGKTWNYEKSIDEK